LKTTNIDFKSTFCSNIALENVQDHKPVVSRPSVFLAQSERHQHRFPPLPLLKYEECQILKFELDVS